MKATIFPRRPILATGLSSSAAPGPSTRRRRTNPQFKCTSEAVTNGLIPNLKPLIPNMQLRDTIVILGGDGNYYATSSSGADTSGISMRASSNGVPADLKKWDYVGEVWSFDKDGTQEKNGAAAMKVRAI